MGTSAVIILGGLRTGSALGDNFGPHVGIHISVV